MSVLKEVREKESSIELDVVPILEMYTMLELYLPGGVFDSEELEQKGYVNIYIHVITHMLMISLHFFMNLCTYMEEVSILQTWSKKDMLYSYLYTYLNYILKSLYSHMNIH
jgi:hypothetical protein